MLLPPVRVAGPADRPAVVETVVAAFAADPAWRYFVEDRYDALSPLFAGALFDKRVGNGTVWMTTDATSVAMWDAPGHPTPEALTGAWAPFEQAASAQDLARLAAYDEGCAQVAPRGPYWYLGVLASHPSAQGRGGATAVLAAGLARADADGLPACLETSTLANRDFYGRRGFTEAVEVPVPQAPPTWWLTRAAR